MIRDVYTVYIGRTVLAKEPLTDLWEDLGEQGPRLRVGG
jgi:hypothetical protein